MSINGLYLIVNDVDPDSDVLIEKTVRALEGGARVIQYRNKQYDSRARYHVAHKLKMLCHNYQVPLIINDDVRLAQRIHADGVHLGRHDLDLQQARQILGKHSLIGVSCYNDIERARLMAVQGADYIAFGSFFPSATKPDAVRASTAILRQARKELTIPVVAIGGITPANGAALLAAGAHALAVVNGIFAHEDAFVAAQQYDQLFRCRAVADSVAAT